MLFFKNFILFLCVHVFVLIRAMALCVIQTFIYSLHDVLLQRERKSEKEKERESIGFDGFD